MIEFWKPWQGLSVSAWFTAGNPPVSTSGLFRALLIPLAACRVTQGFSESSDRALERRSHGPAAAPHGRNR